MFVSKKIEQYKARREEKRNRADEELASKIDQSKQTPRELFLRSTAAEISLDEQADYSKHIQQEQQEKLGQELVQEPEQEIDDAGQIK